MNNHICGSALITHRKPDIDYPCEWEYTVIGADEARLREIIFTACAPLVPAITHSRTSRRGSYCSLNATVRVDDEQQRDAIFSRLQGYPEVKMVI
jgi:putative lipoic acid-binding regulatory protein